MRWAATLVAAFALTSCFGPDPGVTDEGRGRPTVELAAPQRSEAGATVVGELTVTNPGPEEMDSIVVAFSRLGDPELPPPVVDVVPRNQPGNRPVAAVTPDPNAVSRDGVVYTFDGLGEGESRTITFELRLPQEGDLGGADVVGNAIVVYDGADPNRARGVALKIELGGEGAA